MPKKDCILNLPGFFIKKVSGYNPVLIDVVYRRKARCVYCAGKNLRKKDSFIRKVKHESIGHRQTLLQFKAHKFYCRDCGRYFPNAKIVADRFHAIRLINQMGMQSYQALDTKTKYQRGILAILRTKPEKLNSAQILVRDRYLQQQPIIAALYHFKQRLHRLLLKKHRTAKQCKRLLLLFLKYLQLLRLSPFKPLQTLGKTFEQWQEEIVSMWRFTKNNGITEGFHRKMKLIQRRAYGFRNFENYRLRVKIQLT